MTLQLRFWFCGNFETLQYFIIILDMMEQLIIMAQRKQNILCMVELVNLHNVYLLLVDLSDYPNLQI